jgi:amidase
VRSLDKAFNYVPFPGLFNHTGLPALAVPVAETADGFPLGVQLVGPMGSEVRLLALALELERAVGWPARRPPGFH